MQCICAPLARLHTCIHIVVSHLMKIILLDYKSNSRVVKSNICNILEVISDTTVISKKGRYYERIRRRPATKWNNSGTTSGRPRKRKTTNEDNTNNSNNNKQKKDEKLKKQKNVPESSDATLKKQKGVSKKVIKKTSAKRKSGVT